MWDLTHHGAASAGHPPLWEIVLAPLAKVGLGGYRAARLAGAVAGALAAGVIGLLGRRVAGERAGLLAAGLTAIYLPWIVGDTSGMSEALYVLVVGLTVLAVLAARDTPRTRTALVVGVAAALAALTRTEGLLLLPLLVWPALWGLGAEGRSWALPAAATVAAAVVIVPWTARNAVALDRFVPISTNQSTVLAGANCPETYHGRDTGSWRPECLGRALGTVALRDYDEGAYAARWSAAGRRYAGDHLGRLAVVVPIRVLRTWRLWQPSREGALSEGEDISVAKVGAWVFLLGLLPAGLVSVARAGLRRDALLVLAALAAMVTLTSAVGWGAPRFLRPAELALLVAAGAGVDALLRRRAPVS